MADQLDPEQIARASEALEQLINGLGKGKTSAEKYADAQEAFGKKLGKTAADLGSSMYKGEKGVTQFGNAVESVATALSSLAAIAAMVNPALRVLATLTTGLAVFAKGINAAAKQGDALYKTYQDLGRAGATASDGISGVFRNMQNLGYGIEELDKMVALVAQNSETLAKFSLTAADGTNAFADGMARIQRDGQLRLLGKTTDDINSAGAAFVRQQVMLGRRQTDIQGNLGDRTRAYILELDRLQRLTGTSADVLQKQQEEMLSEDAYNVYMQMLEEQGESGQAQIAKIKSVTNNLEPEYRKLVAQAIGGNVEAQQQLMYIAPNLIKDLRDPFKSAADVTKTLTQDLSNFKGVFRENYMFDPTMREFGTSMETINKQIARGTDIDARNAAAIKNAAVIDGSTKSLTAAQIANMNSRDAMQAFIQQGVAPATEALALLAQGASKLAGGAAGAVGAPTGGAAAGGQRPGASGGYIDRIARSREAGAQGYLEKMIQAESGGRNIANQSGAGGAPTSSAFGIGQMLKGTFEDLAKGAGAGNPLHGKTFEDYKVDLDLQREALTQFTDQNRRTLERARVSTTDAALYLAHFLGPGGAVKALKAGDSAPIGSVVGLDQIEANPHLKKMVDVADLKNWADQKMGGSGYRFGGVASGPTSGYTTTLHGTEAIVPLPNGKTIPVEIPGFTDNVSDQTNLMSQQLDKLDELVRVMQSQVSVSNKILQAAN
jgi:ribosomal protein S8E